MNRTPPPKPNKSLPSLTELLSRPDKIAEAIETERRLKSPPGWLGVRVMAKANWTLSLSLGDGVFQVEVDPRSSAYRHASMRTGDYLKPVKVNGGAGIPIDEFDTLGLPVGTKVAFEFYRQGAGRASGWMIGEAMLTAPPRTPAMPEWKKSPSIQCGRRVFKKDRPKFLLAIAGRSDLTPAMRNAVSVLALQYDNDKNDGFWPSYSTMAESFGCSRRHARKLIARLRWVGVLEKISGPNKSRASNTYRLTWPAGHQTVAVAAKLNASVATDRAVEAHGNQAATPRKTWRL
jgi:hypothetical protein